MKTIVSLKTLLLFLLVSFGLNAQSLTLDFAKKLGGTAYDYGQAITTDAAGNIYTTGLFQGTADFDPGVGTQNLTSAGGGDVFISKLDASGDFVWARQIGGISGDRAYGIVTDAAGNVYVTGYFEDIVDFDPSFLGICLLTSLGQSDVFVCKFDASGNFIWAKQMGGLGHDYAFTIALDASGNVYTAGKFYGTADFDPALLSSYNLASNLGSEDAFISCLSASGNFVSACKLGGTSNDNAQNLTFDGSGNLLVTGYFQGTMDADPGVGTANLVSAGGRDVFVLKLNNAGSYVWAKSWGSTLADEGTSVIVDVAGNVYATGFYQGTVDFDPSAAVYNSVSNGGYDVFVTTLDASGNFSWMASCGGPSNDKGNSIALGSDGIYFAGYFQGTADFDPGAGVTSLTSTGGLDIFAASLTYSGSLNQALKMGGTSDDEASAVAIRADRIYTTGYFQSTADFDPGAGVSNLVSAGSFDIFVSKLAVPSTPLPVNLVSFVATPVDKEVIIQWTAGCEQENCSFFVERSSNAADWETIDTTKSENLSSTIAEKTVVDSEPYTGVSYYRLKQTDGNGLHSYGSMVSVKVENMLAPLSVYPNPASSSIRIASSSSDVVNITLYTSGGQIVGNYEVRKDESLDISSLPANTYTLYVESGKSSSTVNLIKRNE